MTDGLLLNDHWLEIEQEYADGGIPKGDRPTVYPNFNSDYDLSPSIFTNSPSFI